MTDLQFHFPAEKEGIELWFPAKQEVVQQQYHFVSIHSMIFVNQFLFKIILNKVNAVKQEILRNIPGASRKFVIHSDGIICVRLCVRLYNCKSKLLCSTVLSLKHRILYRDNALKDVIMLLMALSQCHSVCSEILTVLVIHYFLVCKILK